MSRLLKFRAWHKRWQKMYDWQYCQDNYTLYWLNSALMGEHVLMQYTGLKDKHGVEIYEGDVVRFHFAALLKKPQTLGAVIWHDSGASYQLKLSDKSFTGFYFDDLRQYEVVGNVHEQSDWMSQELSL